MKKIYNFLMLLILSVLLVACGSSESKSKKEDKKTEEGTKKSKKKKKSKKDKKSKDEDSEDEEETKSKKKKKSSKTKDSKSDGDKVIDNDEYSITIQGMGEDSIGEYTINVLVENKSKDTNYMITTKEASVNGVQVSSVMYSDVPAGKEEETAIVLENLKRYGISEYTDIEITILAYNSDDIMGEPLPDETIHIYPYGEEKATKFEYEIKDTDQVLVDNEYITVAYVGSESDDISGYTATIYIVNKTDTKVTLDASDVSVNGYMADPLYMETLERGKSAFSGINWLDSDFESAGIDKSSISNIEFNLDIYDEDNSDREHFFNGKVTITP